MKSVCRYIPESQEKIIAYATITNENIPVKYFCQYISRGEIFFLRAYLL